MAGRGKIIIFYNPVDADGLEDERDVLEQASLIDQTLKTLGYDPVMLAFSADPAFLKSMIAQCNPQAIFNLVESVEKDARLVHLAPAYFEHLNIPYTGVPAEGMLLSTSKILAKKTMRLCGIPTPAWLAPGQPVTGCLTWPDRYIIKPVWEEASVGLDSDAVCFAGSQDELAGLIESRCKKLGLACFAERFIDGREFNLSIIGGPEGPRVLPAAEIIFSLPDGRPRIVDYKAKWIKESLEFENTRRSFDLALQDGALVEKMNRICEQCWDVFALSGYARVDSLGTPFVLEINANPCLSPGSGFPAACEQGGMSYADMVEAIMAQALRRAAP